MSWVSGIRDISDNMFVAHDLHTVIPRPGISPDLGPCLHVIPYESPKARCRQVRDFCHTNPTRTTSTYFNRYCDDCLSLDTPTTNILFDSPDVCFINFNLCGQLIPARKDHGTTQLMEPGPCSIITPKTKDPFQPEGASSMFLTHHKPHGEKPGSKRFVTSMKQSPGNDGSLPLAFSTEEEAAPHQGRLVRLYTTNGTNKAFRPAKPRNIFKASVLAAKPFVKLLRCSRIINAGNWVPWLIHDHILHLVAG